MFHSSSGLTANTHCFISYLIFRCSSQIDKTLDSCRENWQINQGAANQVLHYATYWKMPVTESLNACAESLLRPAREVETREHLTEVECSPQNGSPLLIPPWSCIHCGRECTPILLEQVYSSSDSWISWRQSRFEKWSQLAGRKVDRYALAKSRCIDETLSSTPSGDVSQMIRLTTTTTMTMGL